MSAPAITDRMGLGALAHIRTAARNGRVCHLRGVHLVAIAARAGGA